LIVLLPPQSSLILEESGRKSDAIFIWDWGEGAELLHLEDPCFQGLGFSTTEWRWAVGFDARGYWGLGCRDSCNLVSVLLKFLV
jgi:hypothetical protein